MVVADTEKKVEEFRKTFDTLKTEISEMPTFSADQIRAGVIPISRHQAVIHWFVFAAIACLLAGMVLRRI